MSRQSTSTFSSRAPTRRPGPRRASVVLTSLLALAACFGEDAEAPTASMHPPQTWLSDFTVGTEVGAQGVVDESDYAQRFVSGMVAYYSMRVDAAPPGAEVTVIWGADRDEVDQRETRAVEDAEALVFSADTTDWPPGHYSVEAWAGGEKVHSRIFEVVEDT